MRSRSGCITCRKRKLKCDEAKPVCKQCSKASRACIPSDGITFRHQQNASMNGPQTPGSDSSELKSFYGYRDSFSKNHYWVEIPREVRFVHITDPYSDTGELAASTSTPLGNPVSSQERRFWPHTSNPIHSPSFGLDTLSSVATSDPFAFAIPQDSPGRSFIQASTPGNYHTPPESRPTTGNTPMSVTMSNTSRGATTPIDPILRSPQNGLRSTEKHNTRTTGPFRDSVEDEHEIAFLMRHYAEVPGYGMDLFDCGRFFSFHVPVKAQNDLLLQAAACAYAAKQIARSGGVKSIREGGHAAQVLARMEVWPDMAVNWEYIHEKYYGEAVSLLTRALAEKKHWPEPIKTSPDGSTSASPHPLRTSDELLAATAILCEYEAMDANGVWQKHLAGAKSLLDVAEAGMHASDGLPDSHNEPKFAGARKAIFWNFARQDFAAAFITECQVRLDINNYDMWRAAGLELDEQGCIVPANEFSLMQPFDNHSREDMLANSLILLLSKMNDYIVVGESLYPAGPAHEGKRYEELMSGIDHVGISQQTLLERWTRISEEFDTWYRNLPETFLSVKRISHPVFSEIWHSIPMCASAMQAWHMAKIILLINRPHETTARRTTIGTRLRSYRTIHDETAYHASEICGIALARHECSVRIFSIQPLFVAGSTFVERAQQEVVMTLLDGIETELGWKTDYRREKLLEEWGWNANPSPNPHHTGPADKKQGTNPHSKANSTLSSKPATPAATAAAAITHTADASPAARAKMGLSGAGVPIT